MIRSTFRALVLLTVVVALAFAALPASNKALLKRQAVFSATMKAVNRVEKAISAENAVLQHSNGQQRDLLMSSDDCMVMAMEAYVELGLADCEEAMDKQSCMDELNTDNFCTNYGDCLDKYTEWFQMFIDNDCPADFMQTECEDDTDCDGDVCYNGYCESTCDNTDVYSCCDCDDTDYCDVTEDYCMESGDSYVCSSADGEEPDFDAVVSLYTFMCLPTDTVEDSYCITYMHGLADAMDSYTSGTECSELTDLWNAETLSDCCMQSTLQLFNCDSLDDVDDSVSDTVQEYMDACEIDLDLDTVDTCDGFVECENISGAGVLAHAPLALVLATIVMQIVLPNLF